MHPLDSHQRIGVDFDDTLLYGPCSDLIQKYIVDNAHKKYWIITFRTPTDSRKIENELRRHSRVLLDSFERIIPCPPLISNIFQMESLEDIIAMSSREAMKAVMWKGFACKSVGCTALLDDMPHLVKPGCERYKIEFFNSRLF